MTYSPKAISVALATVFPAFAGPILVAGAVAESWKNGTLGGTIAEFVNLYTEPFGVRFSYTRKDGIGVSAGILIGHKNGEVGLAVNWTQRGGTKAELTHVSLLTNLRDKFKGFVHAKTPAVVREAYESIKSTYNKAKGRYHAYNQAFDNIRDEIMTKAREVRQQVRTRSGSEAFIKSTMNFLAPPTGTPGNLSGVFYGQGDTAVINSPTETLFDQFRGYQNLFDSQKGSTACKTGGYGASYNLQQLLGGCN